jgi:hypothetical protein
MAGRGLQDGGLHAIPVWCRAASDAVHLAATCDPAAGPCCAPRPPPTTLPACRRHKSPGAKHFGWSFVVVGLAAMFYHGVSGRWRSLARKCDYWAICYR